MKKTPIIIVLLILGVTVVSIISAKKAGKDKEKEVAEIKSQGEVTQAPLPPTEVESQKMEIDQTKKYTAVLNTSIGKITIELNAAKTPITVNNFVG